MTAQPSELLPAEAEVARVVPVVQRLRERTTSNAVDTYRADVAEAVLAAGAELVNDHTGLSDPDLAAVVAAHRAGLVVTHLGLRPKQEQAGRFAVAFEGIVRFLEDRAAGRWPQASGRRASCRPGPRLRQGHWPRTSRHCGGSRASRASATRCSLPLAQGGDRRAARAAGGLARRTAAVVAVAAYLGVDVLRLHDLPFMRRVARMGWLLRSDRD